MKSLFCSYSILMKWSVIFANKVLEIVRSLQIDDVGEITVSISLTFYVSEDTLDMMLKRSDDALYGAKRSGKDCLCIR